MSKKKKEKTKKLRLGKKGAIAGTDPQVVLAMVGVFLAVTATVATIFKDQIVDWLGGGLPIGLGIQTFFYIIIASSVIFGLKWRFETKREVNFNDFVLLGLLVVSGLLVYFLVPKIVPEAFSVESIINAKQAVMSVFTRG